MTPLLSSAILRTQSDDRLVELARAGDERAFEAIVHRYGRALDRHCRTVLPEARCDDVVQQTFINAWGALQDDGVVVRDLRPWLHRIARNLALNALRRADTRHVELHEALCGAPSPAEALERREDVRATLAGVAGLPDRQRDALLAVAVLGRAHDDVAAELGMSDGALRQLLHRARTSLRAAAAAVVPLPLLHRLCGGGEGLSAARAGEIVAGAGGAGAAGVAVKGMAVVVAAATVAGGAAGGLHLTQGADTGRNRAAAAPAPVAKAAATPADATDAGATRAAVVAPLAAAAPGGAPTRRRASSSPAPATARRVRRARTPVRHVAAAPAQEHGDDTEDRRGPSHAHEDRHDDGHGSSGSSGASGAAGDDASDGPEHGDAPGPAGTPGTTTEASGTPSGSEEAEDRAAPADENGSDDS